MTITSIEIDDKIDIEDDKRMITIKHEEELTTKTDTVLSIYELRCKLQNIDSIIAVDINERDKIIDLLNILKNSDDINIEIPDIPEKIILNTQILKS